MLTWGTNLIVQCLIVQIPPPPRHTPTSLHLWHLDAGTNQCHPCFMGIFISWKYGWPIWIMSGVRQLINLFHSPWHTYWELTNPGSWNVGNRWFSGQIILFRTWHVWFQQMNIFQILTRAFSVCIWRVSKGRGWGKWMLEDFRSKLTFM